jgi:hypothetical protein
MRFPAHEPVPQPALDRRKDLRRVKGFLGYPFHRGEPANCLWAKTGKARRHGVERLQDSPPGLPCGGDIR